MGRLRMWEGSAVGLRMVIASICLALAVAAVAVSAPGAIAAARAQGSCGAYTQGGEFDGSENLRVAVSAHRVGCGPAIVVVRSFRSRLPKRHHGGAAPAGSWTLTSPPGWSCAKSASGGSCRRGRSSVEYSVTSTHPPQRCKNGVTLDGGVAGVIILSWRHVGCDRRHALARGATRSFNRRFRDHGFTCHRLNLRAGGGGALCRRGSRFIEVGFE